MFPFYNIGSKACVEMARGSFKSVIASREKTQVPSLSGAGVYLIEYIFSKTLTHGWVDL